MQALADAGHEAVDLGTAEDYPDIALAVGRAVAEGEVHLGGREVTTADQGLHETGGRLDGHQRHLQRR